MVICDKIPINWYFIVQEKSFNLQKLNSINMKKNIHSSVRFLSIILSSEVPIIPKDVSIEFDKTLFSDIETKIKGDQVVLNITSNINKEDKILNVDLQISYSTINGIKVEKIPLIIDKGKLTSTGNVWFLTVRKDGEKIGFYKFTFVGEGPYNQKTDPECYFNIYTHDADLITDNPTEIFRQDFIQPQTPGEDYYKPSRSSYKHGTFDF